MEGTFNEQHYLGKETLRRGDYVNECILELIRYLIILVAAKSCKDY